MYKGVINNIAFMSSDERVKSIIEQIAYISESATNKYDNEFREFSRVDKRDVFQAVFRSLLDASGIVEQTRTFYTISSKNGD